MLNELYMMSEMITSLGIKIENKSSLIRCSPNRIGNISKIKVTLSQTGKIEASFVDSETWKTYSYMYESPSDSFPIVKLTNPFKIKNKIEQQAFLEKFRETKKIPMKIPSRTKNSKKSGAEALMEKCFKFAQKKSKDFTRNKSLEAFYIFVERIKNYKGKEEEFFITLLEKIILVWSDDDQKKIFDSFYIVFDIPDYFRKSIQPLNSISTFKLIEEQQLKLEQEADKENSIKKDIFGSPVSVSTSDKMGQLSIPGCGFFYPYSCNEKAKCNASYGRIGGEACLLSSQSRQKLIDISNYIFQSEHKGVYWDNNKNKDESNTIIATCVPIEKNLHEKYYEGVWGKYAFKNNDIDKEGVEENIKTQSSHLIADLRGSKAYKINSQALVMAFRIPGNGPSNMKFSKITDVKTIVSQAELWREGAKSYRKSMGKYNISLFIGKDKRKSLGVSSNIKELYRTINKKWTRNAGVQSDKVVDSKNLIFDFLCIEDIIKLFFSDSFINKRCADILASNHIFLLLDMANRSYNREKRKIMGVRYDVFKVPAVMSLILYQRGIEGEDYINYSSYQLGVLLSHISRLQNDLLPNNKPFQLLGPQYVYYMLHNPQQALNNILKHAHTYIMKAKRNYKITNKDYNYYMIFKIAKKLDVSRIPFQWNSVDKILLSLGYFLNSK